MVRATDSQGNQLLAATPDPSDPDDQRLPLTGALVVVLGPKGMLLVHDVWRDRWELAGGGIEPGETSEQAARREVHEESGQHLQRLELLGSATFRLADGTLERADLFQGVIDQERSFAGNSETDAIRWWDGTTRLPDLGVIDAALIEWATQR